MTLIDQTDKRIEDILTINLTVIRTLSLALELIAGGDPHAAAKRDDAKRTYIRDNRHWEDAFNLVWNAAARDGEAAQKIAQAAIAEVERLSNTLADFQPASHLPFSDPDTPNSNAPAGAALSIRCDLCDSTATQINNDFDKAFYEELGWRFGETEAYCPACNKLEERSYAKAA